MASLGTRHNTAEHEAPSYGTLPLGNYMLEVSASDVTDTKAGTGKILKLTYDVLEPEQFKGRKIFGNMNIVNPNATAEAIGKGELTALCEAVGLDGIEDSEELHFKSFAAKVGIEKAQEGYEPRNKILRFYNPEKDDEPVIGLLDAPPASKAPATRAPANDNRPAASNDNAASGGAKKSTPWGKK